MAGILFAIVLVVVDVEYGSPTDKIPYAGLYSDSSSSSPDDFKKNRKLTHTKVRKIEKSLRYTRFTWKNLQFSVFLNISQQTRVP